ncbi:hypothetical protein CHCC14809_2087 [Bacillus licheniformis]|nr:hypothetical protein B4092_2001 [Bacillus licheniformis]TWN16847.1 hypothetical protein CHCC14564_1412 [Bacillus licheniformis LMG 17339]KYC75320.1 hypothetical protein B4090_2006 [Bacillus licheniformis]OLF86706.1 hypothetical protein B4089_4064 [Bacillus licheniformis]OLF89407.1 hypothetical protein B4094_3053 [Bacillus licheniformis]
MGIKNLHVDPLPADFSKTDKPKTTRLRKSKQVEAFEKE